MAGLVRAQEGFKRVLEIVVVGGNTVEVQPGHRLGRVFLGRDGQGRMHFVQGVLRHASASDDAPGQPFLGTEYVDLVPLFVEVAFQDAVVQFDIRRLGEEPCLIVGNDAVRDGIRQQGHRNRVAGSAPRLCHSAEIDSDRNCIT